MFVRYERRNSVALLVVDNPPVNALSPGVAEALQAAVERANQDAAVNAIAVIGAGRTFMAGADIKVLTDPDIREYLQNILACERAIEDSAKPVVMAMHGTAFGAGLETAMAGHYRIIERSAQVGQPEVKLGLIPGVGGTQRLPRLAGVEMALEMCVFGEPVSAEKARACGLVDEIFEGDVAENAVAAAQRVASRKFVKTRERGEKLSLDVWTWERDKTRLMNAPETAPRAAVAAIRAATKSASFELGLRKESELFEQCRQGPQSRALIHLFFAERAAWKVPDVTPDTKAEGSPVVVTDAPPPVLIKDGVICLERSGSRLCEIVRGPQALPGAIKAALDLARKHGKVPVVVREIVSECLLRRYLGEEEACLRAGASEKQVSEAMLDFGFGRATNEQIVHRVAAAMAQEGAALLARGAVLRTSDIDLISVLACGFPAWRGGVMYYAESLKDKR